jgi:hypothetical protein
MEDQETVFCFLCRNRHGRICRYCESDRWAIVDIAEEPRRWDPEKLGAKFWRKAKKQVLKKEKGRAAIR